jgi:hypothetical protein
MMPRLTVGVVGPTDLVGRAADVVTGTHRLSAVPLPYRREQETPQIVRAHAQEVDAWLFTGVVPHETALAEMVVSVPAEHVSYSGLTLLAALFRLVREDHALTLVSIDTLASAEVAETLAEAGLPPGTARTMTYRPNTRADDMVAFHRDARDVHGATVAITCLRSAYDLLRKEMPVVRLEPSTRDIRAAVDSLVLRTRHRHSSDAQVALGFIQLERDDDDLGRELGELGGAVVRTDAGRYLVVTTRGLLEQATDGLRVAPFLDRLVVRHTSVHVGLGIGRSAGEAAAHAAGALARAKLQGDVAAVLAAPNNADILLNRGTISEDADIDLGRLARRLGMSRATLVSLRRLLDDSAEPLLTASELAKEFAIQERSARRLLKRLERAGAAMPVGNVTQGRIGRPPIVYRMDLWRPGARVRG